MTAPVRLNVYDMYWLNEYSNVLGFGIFHSGVEVYGQEYAYGGHQFPFSGIFVNTPQDVAELGENFKFRESILIGETALSKKSVEKLIKSLGDEYRGDRYHLTSKNCNHFTAELAKILTGIEAPGWINRLATLSGSLPFFERWIPQEWLTPMALEDSIDDSAQTNGNAKNGSTLNYPTSSVDKAAEAVKVCGSPSSRQKPINVQPSSSNGTNSNWKLFRRTSETQSAPNTARNGTSSTTPPLAQRLWNSIKSIGSDDQLTRNK